MAELTSTIGKVGQASAAPVSSETSQTTVPGEQQQDKPRLTPEQVVASIPQAEGMASEQPAQDMSPFEDETPEKTMDPPTLKALIELGRMQDSIVLGGMSFEMATLDDEQQERLFKELARLESTGADSFVNLRRTVVAMSLVSINGQSVDALPDPAPSAAKDALGKRLAIARLLQNNVVDKLYEFYNSLLEKSDKKIDPEKVKN